VRADAGHWARRLRISTEAVELFAACEVVDAHVESFVWTRLAGYALGRRHGPGLFNGCFYSQADLPRMVEAGLSAVVLSVATNPFRTRSSRTATVLANLARLRAAVESHGDRVAVVTDRAGYDSARAAGKLACFLALQGGNALGAPDDVECLPPDLVTRVTLVHLTASPLGAPSAPSTRPGRGLTGEGRAFVEALNGARILVDLAHIGPRGFWDALDTHDRAQPAIVSHTGVRGVHDMWRNIDDDLIGIMFHAGFLGQPFWAGRAEAVVAHIAHVIDVAGEDSVAIGSDFDGLIVPPRDLRTVSELPVLVQCMLDRGFSVERVAKVLGTNYLDVVSRIRPVS